MSSITNIRSALAEAAQTRGEQAKIAKLLGVAASTVTRWIDGGEIPDPMVKLLDLYFFGIIPFDVANESILHSVLEFTPAQWEVISIIATRKGMTESQWIADRIRTFLAFDDEAQKIAYPDDFKKPLKSMRAAEVPPSNGTEGNA